MPGGGTAAADPVAWQTMAKQPRNGEVSAMQDALRTYLALANGLTEVSRKRAKDAAKKLAKQGGATVEQVQALTENLVSVSGANRESLTTLVRYEVDRALGMVGLATADEVENLTARIRDLEAELRSARRQSTGDAAGSAPAATRAAAAEARAEAAAVKAAPVRKAAAKKAPAKNAAPKKVAAKNIAAVSSAAEPAKALPEPARTLTASAQSGAGTPASGNGAAPEGGARTRGATTTPAAAAESGATPPKAPAKRPVAKRGPAKKASAKKAAAKQGTAASASVTPPVSSEVEAQVAEVKAAKVAKLPAGNPATATSESGGTEL
ncbi:MAG: hypothetical protein QOC93_838 [Actinomycetota bacterium]|nr:hypothetical protein [Actinomycetota bacterium]